MKNKCVSPYGALSSSSSSSSAWGSQTDHSDGLSLVLSNMLNQTISWVASATCASARVVNITSPPWKSWVVPGGWQSYIVHSGSPVYPHSHAKFPYEKGQARIQAVQLSCNIMHLYQNLICTDSVYKLWIPLNSPLLLVPGQLQHTATRRYSVKGSGLSGSMHAICIPTSCCCFLAPAAKV